MIKLNMVGFSKYYIKVYVYNFVTNEAISIEDYDFE